MERKNVVIQCPECGKKCDAVEEYHIGDPFWTYVHVCEHCNYTITESEWNNGKV